MIEGGGFGWVSILVLVIFEILVRMEVVVDFLVFKRMYGFKDLVFLIFRKEYWIRVFFSSKIFNILCFN